MANGNWQQKPTELTARTFEHVLKISMVYAALASETHITADALARAVAIGGWLEANTLSLFSDAGLDFLGKVEAAILAILKPKGKMFRRDLQQIAFKRGFNAELFNRALRSLKDNDIVELGEDFSLANRKRFTVEYIPPVTGNR